MVSETQKRLIPVLVLAAAVIAVAGYFWALPQGIPNPQTAYAEVVHMRGQVQKYSSAGELLSHVGMGDLLATGDVIKTGADSSVTILFADTSKLLVADNSSIVLQHMLYSKDNNSAETVIHMNTGSAESRVAKQNGFGARYEVRTPAMQLAVRGTVFITNYDKDSGKASVSVLEGSVAATGKTKEILVFAGKGAVVKNDQELDKALDMLAAPALVNAPAMITNCGPLPFEWKPISGAEAYRLQLVMANAPDAVVYDQALKVANTSLKNLPDADYIMRVRGVDGQGLQGNNAEHLFTLNARPEAPQVEEPLSTQTVVEPKVKFRWTGSFEAKSYQFQVSDQKDFSNLITQVPNLPAEMFGISLPMEPGTYYWRVASVNEFGCQGDFSEAQEFTVATANNG